MSGASTIDAVQRSVAVTAWGRRLALHDSSSHGGAVARAAFSVAFANGASVLLGTAVGLANFGGGIAGDFGGDIGTRSSSLRRRGRSSLQVLQGWRDDRGSTI